MEATAEAECQAFPVQCAVCGTSAQNQCGYAQNQRTDVHVDASTVGFGPRVVGRSATGRCLPV